MFTGIIQEVGTLEKIETRKITTAQAQSKPAVESVTVLTVRAPLLAPLQKIGSSISIDGACLTVVTMDGDSFTVEAIEETLQRTIAGSYQVGDKVNLEPSLKVGDTLDGHMVSGHVDFKAKVMERLEASTEGQSPEDVDGANGSFILRISFPVVMAKYFAMKGSVTINGVSLTISKLGEDFFEVSIIPHTQKVTNLGLLKTGDEVNIEIDLISRYLERLLQAKDQQITYQFLQERGFV